MPACTASDLTPSFEGSNGAAGTIVLTFSLRNTGGGPCHTYGYPGVEFLDKSGAALPTRATRTSHDVLGSVPEAAIVIEPGMIASFRVVANDAIGGGGPPTCTRPYGLQVIAPDDTAAMKVALPGTTYECQAVTVTPLELGTALPPGT